MIIVDSNIIIDSLTGNIPAFPQIFAANDMAICGAIRSEVLAGSNSEKDTQKLKYALDAFANIPMLETDWDYLGLLIVQLRKQGIKVPFPDVIISYLAIKTNSEIWSRDKHFQLIQSAIPNLKLFNTSN